MHYGYRIVEDMIDGLSNYLDGKGLKSVKDLHRKAVPAFAEWGELDLNYKVVAGWAVEFSPIPVLIKLTPNVGDILEPGLAAVEAGVHGLSLINTLLGMAIDVETFRPRLAAVTGGLSGPAIRPVAVRCVHQVAQALPGVPIIGIGGISRARDAVEFLLAGAWAVQVGTANFYDPEATIQIGDGVRTFLAERGLSGPSDLTGKVELTDRVPEPAYRRG